MQMGFQFAFNVSSVASGADLLPTFHGIAFFDQNICIQTAGSAFYVVAVVDGHAVAPDGILYHLGNGTVVHCVDRCAGFTEKIHAVVGLPCTGGF